MGQEQTPAWVRIDDGGVFDGSWQMFIDDFFLFGETAEEARAWATRMGWSIEFFDVVPGLNGRPIPTTANELGAALREYATRAGAAGVPDVIVDHLWSMADAVDSGQGPVIHHGCPDPSIPTAKCTECRMVLDAEVDNTPVRSGTIFDGALTGR